MKKTLIIGKKIFLNQMNYKIVIIIKELVIESYIKLFISFFYFFIL